MQHPLATQSLAPFGFASTNSINRLDYSPPVGTFWVNTERLIAKLWEKMHLRDAQRPLPIRTIIHSILPVLSEEYQVTAGDFTFDGSPYLSRDVAILSSAVQWLGTNCGRCFMYDTPIGFSCSEPELEFLQKFERERWHVDLVCMFTHECNALCGRPFMVFGSPCNMDPSTVSDRDRALVKSLMLWLGSHKGREFIATFTARKDRALAVVQKRRLLRFGLLRHAA